MVRQLLLLLIATLALGSGLYAVRARKSGKRPVAAITTNTVPRKTSAPAPLPAGGHAHPANASTVLTAFSSSTVLRSRVPLLLLVGIILAAGAHLGLGKGSPIAQAAQTFEAQVSPSPSKSTPAVWTASPLSASARSLFSGDGLPPPAAPTPEPTPVVAAVVSTPAPTLAPTPRPAPPIPADGIEGIICALPWPCQEAIAVAACESGRDRNGRLDGSSDTNGNHYGVFQISGIHAWRWPDFWENWMDPAKNAQWAYEIWAEQGWQPWSCRWAIYS